MDDLLKLAERCEAATGPDRLIDAEIGALTQRVRVETAGANASAIRVDEADPGHILESMGCGWWAPKFTAYLDAAMTLVPEGWRVAALEEDWRSGLWRAQLSPRPSAALIAAFDAGKTIGYDTADSSEGGRCTVASAALALCAAALRARSSVTVRGE